MSKIELQHIDKYYGDNHVLRDLSLIVEDGDFMTLLGPSGCGKTTTLRVIAGLEEPQNGKMLMDGKLMIDADNAYYEAPGNRGLNLVFQSYALWPHMTVYENVAFGLKIKKLPKHEVEEKVMHSLSAMRIEEFRDRYPSELSGGQQQRVAIARSIASDPKVLLLDEPLSNLDAKLRIDMRSELMRMHSDMGTTIIYVTHDQVEALTMSTKIALFKEGVLSQVATPMEIYMNPVDLTAAEFIGNPRINLIEGSAFFDGSTLKTVTDIGTYIFDKETMTDAPVPKNKEFTCVIGFRPEEVVLSRQKKEGTIEAKIYSCQSAGSETLILLQAGNCEFLAKKLGIHSYKMNSTVYLYIDPEKINVYDEESTKLIKYAKIDEFDD